MEKLACTNLPGFSADCLPKVPPPPAPPLPTVGVKRAKPFRGPCVRCGVLALIMDDPYHHEPRPICPDHWFDHYHRAKRFLAAAIKVPETSLRFNAISSRSARTLLQRDPDRPVIR